MLITCLILEEDGNASVPALVGSGGGEVNRQTVVHKGSKQIYSRWPSFEEFVHHFLAEGPLGAHHLSLFGEGICDDIRAPDELGNW